jgi:hypothetical protein
MKRSLLLCCLLGLMTVAFGQKFTAEKGQISFFSDAPVEDIEAINTVIGSLFNASTGEVVYILKMRDFIFPKALMREHFNEKYIESEKYPKGSFQGKLSGFSASATGIQNVRAVGKLSVHGVTREIDVPGTIENVNGKLHMKSKFMVKLADYNIKIPTIIWQNIAEEVEVRIDITYKPL